MRQAYNRYLLAADAILIAHFALVAFVVLGFVLIWIGRFSGWKFARNPKFRICHVLAMGIVLCESLFGMICPFTEWENDLRVIGGQGQMYETSFMQEWIHRIMFFNLSEEAFIVLYAVFFALILVTFWIVPIEIKLRGVSKSQGNS